METRFGLVPPWQAGGAAGALAVQVIALVAVPVPAGRASLRETLDAVLGAPVARRVLAAGEAVTDGPPAGFDLMGLRGGDFGERLAGALADAHAMAALPMLLIRADTQGVTPGMIEDAARSLLSGEADTAFGLASDGGFWLLGLRRPDRSLVVGIPEPGAAGAGMAGAEVPGAEVPGAGAGRLLLDRLASAGLRVALAPRLRVAAAAAAP